jgi:hypothetical protein
MIKTLKMLAIMVGMMMSMSLVSCGDDDGPDDPTPTKTYVGARYVVSLSENWYKYFDIEVSYTDILGNNVTKVVDSNMEYFETVETEKAATSLSFTVVGKLKADLSDLDDDTVYQFTNASSMGVYNYQGSTTSTPTTAYSGGGSMTTKSYKGSQIRTFTTKDICSYKYPKE